MEDKNLDRLNKATKIEHQELSESVIIDATTKTRARNWPAIGTVAAAAVLVTTLGVGQLTPKGPLIQLSATSQADSSAKLGSSQSSQNTTMDRMLPSPASYEASTNLSNDGTQGHVYELKVVGDAKWIARRAANALGFSGIESYEDEWNTALIEGDKDDSGYALEAVNASGSGTGYWNYWNGSTVYSDEAVTVPVSNAAATKSALRIFSATGLEVSSSDVRLSRDDFGLSASADLQIDGMQTGLVWSVHWNGEGKIDSASGHSVQLVDRGQFNNVSPTAAVGRLTKFGYWSGVSELFYSQVADKMFSFDSGEVMVVNESTLTNGLIFDAKGNAWLVPTYALGSSDYGFQGSVIALVDGVIELPKEPEVMQMDSDVSTR